MKRPDDVKSGQKVIVRLLDNRLFSVFVLTRDGIIRREHIRTREIGKIGYVTTQETSSVDGFWYVKQDNGVALYNYAEIELCKPGLVPDSVAPIWYFEIDGDIWTILIYAFEVPFSDQPVYAMASRGILTPGSSRVLSGEDVFGRDRKFDSLFTFLLQIAEALHREQLHYGIIREAVVNTVDDILMGDTDLC